MVLELRSADRDQDGQHSRHWYHVAFPNMTTWEVAYIRVNMFDDPVVQRVAAVYDQVALNVNLDCPVLGSCLSIDLYEDLDTHRSWTVHAWQVVTDDRISEVRDPHVFFVRELTSGARHLLWDGGTGGKSKSKRRVRKRNSWL